MQTVASIQGRFPVGMHSAKLARIFVSKRRVRGLLTNHNQDKLTQLGRVSIALPGPAAFSSSMSAELRPKKSR